MEEERRDDLLSPEEREKIIEQTTEDLESVDREPSEYRYEIDSDDEDSTD